MWSTIHLPMQEPISETCDCSSAFSYASPKENTGSSEPASPERVPANRGGSYPLSPVLPLQIANAALVCNLRPGGISISLRTSLNRPEKPPSVFLDFSRVICSSSKLRTPKGSPWAQGADSPYQGEMARRANGGRDAGAKRLRGCGRQPQKA